MICDKSFRYSILPICPTNSQCVSVLFVDRHVRYRDGMGILGTLVWLLLCYLVGRGAQNQNRSFLVWFLISLVTTPLIGFLGILLLPRKSPSGYLE